jgi:uncharacterized membrane protein
MRPRAQIMTKRVKWLLTEIDKWMSEGIISVPQAEKIKGRYTEADQGIAWNKIIFSSIGSILVGLGVILFFAYNWQKIPKFLKLALVFSSLLAAHASGFILRRSDGRYKFVGEGLHVLGTMLFGAGIWLIAQIYHIEEHYPNAFLIWGGGAALLAWALPSVAHGILASALFVLWNSFEALHFMNPNYPAPFVLLLTLFPLAWVLRSRILLGIGGISYLLSLIFTLARVNDAILPAVMSFNAAAFIGAGILLEREGKFPEAGPVLQSIGSMVYFATLYIITFPHFGRHFVFSFQKVPETLFFCEFLLAAVAVWSFVFILLRKKPNGIKELLTSGKILIPLVILVLAIETVGLGFPLWGGWGKASLFNLIFLTHCILLILTGCRRVNLRLVIIGCLLLALLSITRFIDLFDSLLVRSAFFLLFGAILFGIGIYYSRSKREMQENRS